MNLPRSPPPPDDTPWLVLGDFNLTRFPQNKNNDLFNHREASLFNDAINSLGLIELPLLDRAYTWSNRRDTPTLARLDRAFVNLAWDHKFPNTNLSSLTRFNSDHVPLKVTVSTAIPRSHLFRFENSWLLHNSFRQLLESSLAGAPDVCTGSSFSRLLKRCRKACRSWARRLHSAQQREIDTKILINGLDLLEEARPLSAQENILRTLAANSLHSIAQEKLRCWRQRFSFKLALHGDENTRFFHASATHRKRKNTIRLLEHNGVEHTTHAAKENILHDFYLDLLGSAAHTSWSFSLAALYPNASIPGHLVSVPFMPDEIRAALFAMDMNSSPGPDGFGPSFYRSFWTKIEPAVLNLFAAFHDGSLDLDALNRAHLVLLPKK